ncbi:MAG: winged helix DNA-binding domain-containing protein [Geodermatophilaceae bacterium]
MSLTARALNRATLARQMLLRRECIDPVTAIQRLCALQAQEAASPYIALWNRLEDFDPVELDSAFAEHTIVKATLLRTTLHAVAMVDYPRFHCALSGYARRARTASPRFASTELSDAEVAALAKPVAAFASQARTNAEMAAFLQELLGPVPDPGVWWAVRPFAPIVHVPTGGPWSFGYRPSFVAARTEPVEDHADQCMDTVAYSYLAAFGPASVLDFAQFCKVARSDARAAFGRLQPRLEPLDGGLYDVPHGARPDPDTPGPPRLLPMWDSVLFAYADRSRVIPAPYRSLVIRQNGDTLPTILIDGQVAGVWLAESDGIRVIAFYRLDTRTWDELAVEAASLVAFLGDREPLVYRRYRRWWAKLPSAESRVLPGR